MKGREAEPGSIQHHIKLMMKMKTLYNAKKSFEAMKTVEEWTNLTLREKHGWEAVEAKRAEKKSKRSRKEEDAEEWLEVIDSDDED